MKVNHGLLTRDIPDELAPYSRLAADLRWTWSHAGDAVWRAMDSLIWEQTENPHVVLQNLSQKRLEELANDSEFVEHLREIASSHEDYCCLIKLTMN